MKKTITFLILLISGLSVGQRVISQEFFEGKLGDKEISLYLKISETGCPNVYAEGIYKYKANKNAGWIQLDITFSEEKNQFTLVEHFNTGILILHRKNGTFNGIWISPDGKKQLKVNLKKTVTPAKTIKKFEDILEKTNYENNDC